MLGPFAVIGIGVDLVEVPRMRLALARTPGLRRRVFTDDEQAYCERRRDPTERYAARFAAKEATMKALGVGLGAFAFRDVEVVRAPSGEPSLCLRGKAEALADRRGVDRWLVTLTHTATLAEAIVVAR